MRAVRLPGDRGQLQGDRGPGHQGRPSDAKRTPWPSLGRTGGARSGRRPRDARGRRRGHPPGGRRGWPVPRSSHRRPDRRPEHRADRPAGQRRLPRPAVAGRGPRRGESAVAGAARRRYPNRAGPDGGGRRRARGLGAPHDPRARARAGAMTSGPIDPGGLLVGVDIGGSKIAVLVADDALAVRGRLTRSTEVGAPERAAEVIAAAVREALDDAGATRDAVAGVGVGVPGRVDPASGVVSLAVNLGWNELPLGPRLSGLLGLPVAVENDVRAAAAGLYERRVLGDVYDLAYLSIGTGISAGVVIDGRLHRGARGLAGEIGHSLVDPAGPTCACGLRGCLEALAAGPA